MPYLKVIRREGLQCMVTTIRVLYFIIAAFFVYQGGLCLLDETRGAEHTGAVIGISIALLGMAFTLLVDPRGPTAGGYQPEGKTNGKVITNSKVIPPREE